MQLAQDTTLGGQEGEVCCLLCFHSKGAASADREAFNEAVELQQA